MKRKIVAGLSICGLALSMIAPVIVNADDQSNLSPIDTIESVSEEEIDVDDMSLAARASITFIMTHLDGTTSEHEKSFYHDASNNEEIVPYGIVKKQVSEYEKEFLASKPNYKKGPQSSSLITEPQMIKTHKVIHLTEIEIEDGEVKDDEVVIEGEKEDEVKGDEIVEDEVKDGEVKDGEVKDGEVKDDEVKDDEVKDDEATEDEVVEDEVKEDEVKEDEVKEDEVKEDEAKEDKVVVESVQPETKVVESTEGESYAKTGTQSNASKPLMISILATVATSFMGAANFIASRFL